MSNETEQNEQVVAAPDTSTVPESPSWDDFLRQLDVAPATNDDPAWQTALERVNLQDPSRILDGQRFAGQGQ